MAKNKTKPEENVRNIGIEVDSINSSCTDSHCAFHGKISLRGREFVGTVAKAAAQKTAVVSWVRLFFLPKYQRYEKRRSKLHVHNPSCINAQVGDRVRIVECRPISKTKNFIIVERMKQ